MISFVASPARSVASPLGFLEKRQQGHNAIFQLSLWMMFKECRAHKPTTVTQGSDLCVTTFYPPQTPGTWIDRYQYSLYAANLAEAFYNRILAPPDSLAMTHKSGGTTLSKSVRRLLLEAIRISPQWRSDLLAVLSYIPPAGTANQYQFGWKTSITHNKDDAVYGHMNVNNLRCRIGRIYMILALV